MQVKHDMLFKSIKHSYILGLLSFFFFSLSLLIGYDEEAANHVYTAVKMGLIAVSALLFLLSCSDNASSRAKLQYSFLSLIILVYEILLVTATGQTILYIKDYPAILNCLSWTAVSLISIIRFRLVIWGFLTNVFKEQTSRILIYSSSITAIMVILLSLEPNGVRFTWDSDTLYQFIYDLDYRSLYDAKLLTFHSHVSAVYAHILVLLKILLGDIRIAFFVLNTLCIICASFGMTFLLRTLLPNRSFTEYTLGNMIFMLSPWVCGLSTLHMYDYYIWCLFPLLIYYVANRSLIGYMVVGVMITFSKSTGFVVFGSVCVGIVIADMISMFKRRQPLVSILINNLTDIRNWCFASIIPIFYTLFRLGISSDTQFEDTRFGIDIPHIIHQVKLYSLTNSIWIFVILTCLCAYFVFFKQRSNYNELTRMTLSIILISDVVFFTFNCLCITYRIPRYMDSHISIVYIASAILILSLSSVGLRYSLAIILCVIGILNSFRSIDPISSQFFKTMNVGDHTIVDYEMVTNASLGDSIICNREYYSYETLLNKALTYVINNRSNNDEIMFSLGKQPLTWGFSGGRYSYACSDGKHYFEEFYDKEINGLANGYKYEYYDSEDMIPFEMHYIFDSESIAKSVSESKAETFYYLYMPTLNAGKEQEIYEKFKVASEEAFEFRGWQMNCIKFTGYP